MDNEETQSEPDPPSSRKDRLKNRILKAGESFGNFRVVKCISSSLLANYYHMQHVRDLHDVTVCVFHPRTMDDSKYLKRLEGIQAALKTIDHEGIPRIQDCAVINKRHCIFMDPVKGQSLSHYFAEHAKPGVTGLAVEDVTRIVALLLGVLGYAHAQGVDHRDMDTDLIFIQSDGSLQMLGLGVKATLGGELFESVVSASVSPLVANEALARLSSFDVMSPEYRRGISEDSRVDIFASGYIAYWLLTGLKVNVSAYQSASSLVPGLSNAWDSFIETALQRNRDDRYQSCKSGLIALKATEVEPESEGAGLIQRQIDRIPVPRGIVARGELATRIYRLVLIGLVGLTLTGLLAAFLNSTFDESAEPQRVILVATEDVPANFRLNLVPAEAKVRFIGVNGIFSADSGELALVMQPGEYGVRISAPNYMEQQISVSITDVALPIVNVELTLGTRALEIQTEPGATIVLRDEEGLEVDLGVADAEGIFNLKPRVFDGTSSIVVRKMGYSPKVLEDLSDEQVQALLVELPSSVTVRTQPAGARVMINHVDRGHSPITINVLEESGHYVVVVDSQGYRSEERRIHVDSGEHEVIDFGALTRRSAALDFTVTFVNVPESDVSVLMEDVEVEIDEQRVPYASETLNAVSEGGRLVRLFHPLYVSELQAVTVEDQVDQTLSYTLSPLPGRVELVLPSGLVVDVRVNSERVDAVDGAISVAANQRVEIELSIKDYLTMVRYFKLKPNEPVVWDVAPVQIPGPEPAAGWTTPYSALKLSWVEAGDFSMGSPLREAGRLPNEGPQTSVRFSQGFWAGVHEVTQAQYFRIMDQNPSEVSGDSLPVDSVSWGDARLFCRMLTNLEESAGRLPDGYVYRLPTEAEWEYAARSGTVSPFTFGGHADASYGNFRGIYPVNDEYAGSGLEHYGPLAVGSYSPNAYGLYDTHGNVAEWTLDRYNGRLVGGSLQDPRPRDAGRRVAVRGGSWEDFSVKVRSAAREEIRSDLKSNAIGFRIVLAPAF